MFTLFLYFWVGMTILTTVAVFDLLRRAVNLLSEPSDPDPAQPELDAAYEDSRRNLLRSVQTFYNELLEATPLGPLILPVVFFITWPIFTFPILRAYYLIVRI